VRKLNDEHWGITSVVSQLHKKLVGGRETAGKQLDEAANIAQQHHNGYVREAERQQREAQDRLRRQAEADAQLVRDAELAKLEAEAVAREEQSIGLSEREQLFVDYVLQGSSAQRAATLAGYANPLVSSARLSSSSKIQRALEVKREAQLIREQAAAKRESPIIADVPTVRSNVTHAAGSFDRSTYSAEVFDPEAFMAALLDPRTRTQLGIPAAIATFSQPALNESAKSLRELINRWPGCRLAKKTTTV
jgi:hypothetical protein